MLRLSSFVAAIAVGLLVVAGSAIGDGHKADEARDIAAEAAPYVIDGEQPTPLSGRSLRESTFAPGDHQHGGSAQHLPSVRENIDIVGKLELDTPDAFKFDPDTGAPDPTEPDVVAGQIADLAVYKDAAYLASWSEPSCRRGGFFSADISNPASPQQRAFVPALPETYHGEGMHATTLDTPSFRGDVLITNNEPCGAAGVGGFDLYDVSDPANPQILIQGAGDQSPDDTSEKQDPAAVPNSSHSSFIWQDGPRAYAVTVDNTELHDVDIFDITDPRNPVFVGDHDLVELAAEQGVDIIDNSANGDAIFLHDMVVKEIGGVQTLLASYWDAGYVKVNVDDPASPQIIGDSAFDQQDPLVTDPRTGEGFERPEGNGHQAEFSHDNRFVMAADEDFSTYRTDFEITSGPNAGPYESGEFGFSQPIATLPDKRLNGPTVYGGYGCDARDEIPAADTAIPPGSLAAGEDQIVVLQRGPVQDPAHPYRACRFDEKLQNAADKGYEGAIIANHHNGAGGGASPDAAFCGGGDPRAIRGMCIGHRAFHLLFNDAPDYDLDYTPNSEPAVGTIGEDVAATALFDGWGYLHLYRNDGDDLTKVDDFAIEEATDERYASGFGDLSVHEVATDPTVNLAYSSHYAGGLRVFAFDDSGIRQVGKFIDEGGSNFWGVEQFTTPQGDRLIAGSDRDFGLYLARYTGPGAAQKPVCSDTSIAVPSQGSVAVPLACSDANGNTLTRRIVSGPSAGSLGPIDEASATVTYTNSGQAGGTDSFRFEANDGAASSAPATATISIGSSPAECQGVTVGKIGGLQTDDTLIGTAAADAIFGFGGDDALDGVAGDDCLDGGDGNDTLRGGAGDDLQVGGADNDKIRGQGGKDQLKGDAGKDRINGGEAKDALSGGAGDDKLRGAGANDRLKGNAGDDKINSVDAKVDKVNCGGGKDEATVDLIDKVAKNCETETVPKRLRQPDPGGP